MAELPFPEFARRLQECSPEPLAEEALTALHVHYRLLLKWNDRVSLIGPGTVADAVEVHYCDALAALSLIPSSSPGTLVDVGSGAGFPGLVLAAARPGVRAVLVEPRERKWAFLKKAALEAGIRAECLLGGVDRAVPADFPDRVDWVTLRALKLSERAWEALSSRLADHGRVLVWAGREEPMFPVQSIQILESLQLPGSRWKRIVVLGKS